MLFVPGIESEYDFQWLSQLRYYIEMMEETEQVRVRITNSNVKYAYEYLGNTPRSFLLLLTVIIVFSISKSLFF